MESGGPVSARKDREFKVSIVMTSNQLSVSERRRNSERKEQTFPNWNLPQQGRVVKHGRRLDSESGPVGPSVTKSQWFKEKGRAIKYRCNNKGVRDLEAKQGLVPQKMGLKSRCVKDARRELWLSTLCSDSRKLGYSRQLFYHLGNSLRALGQRKGKDI